MERYVKGVWTQQDEVFDWVRANSGRFAETGSPS